MIAFIDVLKSIQEINPVLVVLEDGLLFIPAARYVVDSAGVFDAQRAGHGVTIAQSGRNGKKVDLTPWIPSHYNVIRIFTAHVVSHVRAGL